MNDAKILQRLYKLTAPRYESEIIPLNGRLAASLSDWIFRCLNDHLHGELYDPFEADESPMDWPALKTISALDIGTGTGILARLLAERLGRADGLDISQEMLSVAQQKRAPNNRFFAGNVHDLPIKRGAYQAIVSTFGFNATDPKLALKAIYQALPPSGLLSFQEWGARDEISKAFNEVFDQYAPEDVPGLDADLQAHFEAPSIWQDKLQDVEDHYQFLKQIGFRWVWAKEAAFATVPASIADFVRYKLAWPSRRFYVEALADPAAFMVAVTGRLQEFSEGGKLPWKPPLFRVCAVK